MAEKVGNDLGWFFKPQDLKGPKLLYISNYSGVNVKLKLG